jgi:hypothetical protein
MFCTLARKKEHRLTVFENMALRRIFGPKRDEVIGGWRKLLKKELQNLYSSPNNIRFIKSSRGVTLTTHPPSSAEVKYE